MSVVQAAANLHSLYPMLVNLAQCRGTVGTLNNRNIGPKIIYSLLTCRFFRKLNRDITFLVIALLCSITLILSLSSTVLNSFHTKIKTIHWSLLITFLILIVIIFIQFIWVHALLIRLGGDIEMNPRPKPNPCLEVESGVQSSLHQNCHHQIVFARFNLKVTFPPPYEREVWHFQKANIDHIRKAINGFQWEKSFQNMNVNDMVHLFNRTIKNILPNFIPQETIAFDDRDPPWINSSIRRLIQDKNEAYKHFKRSNNNNHNFENFQSLQNLLGVSIEASKKNYYSHLSMKLMELSTSPKTYWSVLKSFHNNKKIPCIQPIFYENTFVTNF